MPSLAASCESSCGGSRRRTFCAEEFAGDVQGFAADHDDLLAIEELLCDDTGKTTEQVSLAVDDNLKKSMLVVDRRSSLPCGLLGRLTTGSKVDILPSCLYSNVQVE